MRYSKRISAQLVIREYLLSEWYSVRYDPVREKYQDIIDCTDINNPIDNAVRCTLLWTFRGTILNKLPSCIEWYLVELEPSDLSDLQVIQEKTWAEEFGSMRTVKSIAAFLDEYNIYNGIHAKKILDISKNPKDVYKHNLIGITTAIGSPVTLIDGNHRAISYLLKNNDHWSVPDVQSILVGVSEDMKDCCWL
jgi:hypothetical protein